MKFFKIKEFGNVLVDSLNHLKRNDPLRLAGATAFFATFALPPTLIILLQLFGLIVDRRQLGQEMFHTLSETLGVAITQQILTVFRGMKALAINWYIAAGGFVFLLFVSTTLFKVIKDSINQLWQIRAIDKTAIRNQLRSRFESFVVIIVAGILFFAGIIADSVQSLMSHYLHDNASGLFRAIIFLVSKLISLAIVTAWFTLLFRYLPDGRPGWRVAITGGLLTGMLFTIGKIVLRILLPYKNISSVFGASGSFVLLLLFVFYTSFILYFGACFTKIYASFCRQKIQPRHYASAYKVTNINLNEGK